MAGYNWRLYTHHRTHSNSIFSFASGVHFIFIFWSVTDKFVWDCSRCELLVNEYKSYNSESDSNFLRFKSIISCTDQLDSCSDHLHQLQNTRKSSLSLAVSQGMTGEDQKYSFVRYQLLLGRSKHEMLSFLLSVFSAWRRLFYLLMSFCCRTYIL